MNISDNHSESVRAINTIVHITRFPQFTRINRRSYRRHGCHAPDGTAHGVVSRFSRRAREDGHELGTRCCILDAVFVMELLLGQGAELTHGEVSRKVVQEFLRGEWKEGKLVCEMTE